MRDINELISNIKGGGSSAHAYIIEGASAASREELIQMLISGLGIHGMDIVRMQMSGKNGYRTEDANAFSERLEMGAYGSYVLGIIDDADSLSEVVQNKLLKTLEEPRDSVILLLGTANRDSLLSTVQSRCSVLRLADYLEDAGDEEDVSEAIRDAVALMTADDTAFHEFRDAIDKCVRTRGDALRLIDVLEESLRESMRQGDDPLSDACRIELAEKARMDIERDMDKSRALKRLYLEIKG